MKVSVVLCVLTFVALAYGTPYSDRGCYYDERGSCMEDCEEGTHSYTSGCGPVTPEATCDNPTPQPEEGAVCDYSNCYCDPPTVRDTVSGKCVPLEKCPEKKNVTPVFEAASI